MRSSAPGQVELIEIHRQPEISGSSMCANNGRVCFYISGGQIFVRSAITEYHRTHVATTRGSKKAHYALCRNVTTGEFPLDTCRFLAMEMKRFVTNPHTTGGDLPSNWEMKIEILEVNDYRGHGVEGDEFKEIYTIISNLPIQIL